MRIEGILDAAVLERGVDRGRRRRTAFAFAVCAAILTLLAARSDADAIETLLAKRTAGVWIEGQRMGDMIIGARARLEFVLLDRELSEAVARDPSAAPEWLSWHNNQHFGKDVVRKKVLFVVRYEALIPWTFDPEKLFVGDYSVRWADILTRRDFIPHGELPSGTEGALAFAMPEKALSVKEVRVGYEQSFGVLTLPGR